MSQNLEPIIEEWPQPFDVEPEPLIADGFPVKIRWLRLGNRGLLVVNLAYYRQMPDGKWQRIGGRGSFPVDQDDKIDPGQYGNTAENQKIVIRAQVIAGKDVTGKEIFEYSSTSPWTANYKVGGATVDPQLVFEGIRLEG